MTTHYINNDSGNNGNSGADGDQWETIAYALTQISDGDAVYVENSGVAYDEGWNFTAGYSTGASVRAACLNNRPTVTLPGGNAWRISGSTICVRGFDFTGCAAPMLRLGNTAHAASVMVQDVSCFTADHNAIWFDTNGYNVNDAIVDGCHFRDIRSRSSGSDRNAVVFGVGGTHTDVTFQNCAFEDIGADGIHVLHATSVINLTIQDSAFFINRPYSNGGTSLYNGDTTTWQSYSTNVGENGVDLKRSYGGVLTNCIVRRCGFYGFYESESGQDASGGLGEGIVIHDDAYDIELYDCVFYDCDIGIAISIGTDGNVGVGADVHHNLIHRCGTREVDYDDVGVRLNDMISAYNGVIFHHNLVVNCTNYNVGMLNSDVVDFDNNIIINGSCWRGAGNSNEGAIDYNLWDNVTPPNDWIGGNDYIKGTEAPVDFSNFDTLAGIVKVAFRFAAAEEEFYIHLSKLAIACHPSLANLEADIEAAALGATLTITEESADPQRYSVVL